MVSVFRRRLTQVLLWSMILIDLGLSNKAKSADAAPAAEQVPLITVEVERNGKEVSSPFTIKVTIANTLGAPVYLKQLKTIIPAAVSRRVKSGEKATAWEIILFDKVALAAGQKRVVRIEVPPSPAFEPAVLFFIASKLETGVTLSYDVEALNEPTREIDATTTVEWAGNMWGKLFGGIIGCCALALFLASREITERSLSRTAITSFASSFFSTFVLGVATVVAAILLVAFLAPGSLPITFSVDDWRGGALLGLFSVSIGRWLLDKLGSKSPPLKSDKEN
jgi:hypothetical protein